MNLRKIKWLIFGTYHHPSQPVRYFFEHAGYALGTYRQTYEKLFLAGDFNTQVTGPYLPEFLNGYDSKSLVNDETCFKNPENPRCIDIFIKIITGSFQKTTAVTSGLSGFHKMIVTVCKTSFQKSKPEKILYTSYKNFDINTFTNIFRPKLQSISNYESLDQVFLEELNEHAPLNKMFLGENHVP